MSNIARVENYIRLCKENSGHNFGEPVGSDFAFQLAREMDGMERKIDKLMNEKTTLQSDTPNHAPKPLYSCSVCREDCSCEAEDLFWYAAESRWVCENCWDELPAINDGEDSPKKGLSLKEYLAYANLALEKQVEELKKECCQSVTRGKLEALSYTAAEKERYGKWVTEGEMYSALKQERDSLKAQLAEYEKLFVDYDGGAIGLALHLSANNQLRQQLTQLEQDNKSFKEALIQIRDDFNPDATLTDHMHALDDMRNFASAAIDNAIKAEGHKI